MASLPALSAKLPSPNRLERSKQPCSKALVRRRTAGDRRHSKTLKRPRESSTSWLATSIDSPATGPAPARPFSGQEKQAARVHDQMNAVRSGAQQAQAEQALSDLARSLESLASTDGSLREAIDRLNRALGPGALREWRRDEARGSQSSGLFMPPTDYTESLHQVVLALQARIQQLMLDQALMERDQAVPPRYKSLVEDYYRVLSQDLR